jgi:hypothetical protein
MAKKSAFLSWLVFIPTAILILAVLVLTVFPAILIEITSGIKYPVQIDSFELGVWAIPLLATNSIVFGIIISYYKGKIPSQISKPLKSIFEFEVTKKMAILVLVVMIGGYCIFTVNELEQKDPWEDFERTTKPALQSWSIDEPFSIKTLVYLLGNVSFSVFGTYSTIPFFASIVFLVLTYLITLEIAKKRVAGLVATILVIQSSNFLTYDTTITYPNFWGVFYLLSLYLIFKKWHISIVSFVLSVLTKILAIGLFPLSLAFTILSEVPIKKKALIIASYCTVPVVAAFLYPIDEVIAIFNNFSIHDFFSGLTVLSAQFRYDGLIVLFLLPVVFGLFIKARNGFVNANSVMVLIFGMFLLAVLIPAFTTYTNSPYRFVPLSAFFAIGVGTILSKKIS